MKRFFKYSVALACIAVAAIALYSCEWDTSEDADFPMYVTYDISATDATYEGPDSLLIDIQKWIRDNMIIYDIRVDYTTGAASEFVQTDTEARKKYDTVFLPKFKAYMKELDEKLEAGAYSDTIQVNAVFYSYATRRQGQEPNLRYDEFTLVYPKPTE